MLERPVVRSRRVGNAGPRPPVGAPTSTTRGRPPNIVIYVIDTLRADHVGCYGYPKPITPRIDGFAREAIIFERTVAQSSWTKPSVASIFTGVWPGTHRVVEEDQALSEDAVTLAEVLHAHGFKTAAFVANGHVNNQFGFEQGFEKFVFLLNPDDQTPPPSDFVNRRLFPWLPRYAAAQPFFLYIHTVDPHSPYAPPREFRERFAGHVQDPEIGSLAALKTLRHQGQPTTDRIRDLVALYDAEVALNDQSFGAFVDKLQSLGVYDDTLVVLTSDHGEEFHEHGTWEHSNHLHGELLDVPLIIKLPAWDDRRGERQRFLAQHIDIGPTILGYLGIPVPAHVEGTDILDIAVRNHEDQGAGSVFSHLDKGGRRSASVIDGAWKLIRWGPPASERFELYDLRSDAAEAHDVMAQHPIIAGYLRAQLEIKEARGAELSPAVVTADEATRANLKALGYVEP